MSDRHERFTEENAALLARDVWAEDDPAAAVCPGCGAALMGDEPRCRECGMLRLECNGACSACFLRVCVRTPKHS